MSGNLSLRDYIEIEQRLFACDRHGWRAFAAGFKMPVAMAAIAANVVVAKMGLSLFLFSVAAAILIWSRVPVRQMMLFLLAPAWATVLVMAGFSVGFGVTPVYSFGPLTVYREGIMEGLSAAARVACDMAWIAALFLTTPFTEQMSALKRVGIPSVIIETLSFMYRYVFLLWDEFERMWTAAKARGGMNGRRRKIDTISRMAAQIFLNAFDRAARIDISVRARGGAS